MTHKKYKSVDIFILSSVYLIQIIHIILLLYIPVVVAWCLWWLVYFFHIIKPVAALQQGSCSLATAKIFQLSVGKGRFSQPPVAALQQPSCSLATAQLQPCNSTVAAQQQPSCSLSPLFIRSI